MNKAARQKLELFVEKADELAQWASDMEHFGGLFGIYRVGQEEWQVHAEIKGFLLTFRLFIQRGDRMALYLHNERSPLLDLPEMSARWRGIVEPACQMVADFMAMAPSNLIYNGQPITRWEVLDSILYGYFAHNNERKRNIFNQWRHDAELYGDLLFTFNSVLVFMFGQILRVAEASKQELQP